MEPIIRKSILVAFAVAAAAVSSQAGQMPPAIDTLTCNKKTVTDAWGVSCGAALTAKGGSAVALPGHGEVRLVKADGDGWTAGVRRVDDGAVKDLFEIELAVSGGTGMPKEMRLDHVMQQLDVQYALSPDGHSHYLAQRRQIRHLPQGRLPLFAYVSATSMNRLTISCSEALRPIVLDCGEDNYTGSILHSRVCFFGSGGEPLSGDYRVRVRYDFRNIPYWDAVTSAGEWITSFPGQTTPPTPSAAWEPLWNSWYGYWIGITAEDMEKEGDVAASLGIRTVVYDMGWDRNGKTNECDFSRSGDWLPDPVQFPQFKEHIARMHAKGLKCMLWCGISLMGARAKNFARFKGKFLYDKPRGGDGCQVLDPRFPEVREFIIASLERGLRDWDVDGWKIDFIQRFQLPGGMVDPVERDGLNGRDFRDLAAATRKLEEDIGTRLRAIRPDVLLEFLQPYAGALGQRVATIIRVGDCPGDAVFNRYHAAMLRLYAGSRVATHVDMLTWSGEETPEACGVQVYSSLHGVIQWAVRLTVQSPRHRKLIAFWTKFQKDHAKTLFFGAFRPHGPESSIPWLEMESAVERIVTVHVPNLAVPVKGDRPTYVMNGTDAAGLVIDADRALDVEIFDICGVKVGSVQVAKAGLCRLDVPRSGFVKAVAACKERGVYVSTDLDYAIWSALVFKADVSRDPANAAYLYEIGVREERRQ